MPPGLSAVGPRGGGEEVEDAVAEGGALLPERVGGGPLPLHPEEPLDVPPPQPRHLPAGRGRKGARVPKEAGGGDPGVRGCGALWGWHPGEASVGADHGTRGEGKRMEPRSLARSGSRWNVPKY